MSIHRYPHAVIRADYVRAAAGLAVTLLPLLAGRPGTIATVLLLLVAALFATFALRTRAKQLLVLRCDEDGVATERGKKIVWKALRSLHLRYYATKRDRKQGWMHLTLKDDNTTMRLESTLENFDTILRRAADAAAANGLVLTPTTQTNLAGRGVETEGATPTVPEAERP